MSNKTITIIEPLPPEEIKIGHLKVVNHLLWLQCTALWDCRWCADYEYLVNTETDERTKCPMCQ